MAKLMATRSACGGVAVAVAALVLLLAAAEEAEARPRYLAIPLEDVALVEVDALGPEVPALPALVRAPRRAPQQVPIQQARVERSHHHHHHDEGHHAHGPHVDYGAHTGHHGAFGWYADFPVLKHH